MWLCTSFGILMPAIRPPKTVSPLDDRTMQIRARRAKELDILRATYMPGKLGPTLHTRSMDYEYRAYCTPDSFALAVARMITEIDYLKFKPTTDRYADYPLHKTYNRMWGVVMDELSTDEHRYEYRHSTFGDYKYTPTKYNTGKTIHHSTATPAVKGGALSETKPVYTAPTTLFGPEDPRPTGQQWPTSKEWSLRLELPFPGETTHRSTAADRDEYEPDPADAAFLDDADVLTEEETKLVDSLYAEIDAILAESRQAVPIDHGQCTHAPSDNARARCRRRRRRDQARRIAEIRALIEESYEDAKTTGTGVIEAEVVS